MLFWFSVSSNTNEIHVSCYVWTLYASEGSHKAYHSTRFISFVCTSSVHSRLTYGASTFRVWTSGFPFACSESNYLPIIQCFATLIFQCATSSWAELSSLWMAWIKLFTWECSTLALYCSIPILSFELFNSPENSYIIRYYESQCEWNPSVAVTWSLNAIQVIFTTYQSTLFFVFYWWDSSIIVSLPEH